MLFALRVGEPIEWSNVFNDPNSIDRMIVLHVRLPRILLGALAGSGLAITGASFQALLRNPLAEPYVLGVAGGAALGATVALAFGVLQRLHPLLNASAVSVCAALGGLLATLITYSISHASSTQRLISHSNSTHIILAGVVVNAIAASAITFIKSIVRAPMVQQLLFWLVGFLEVPTPNALIVVALCVGVGSIVLLRDAAYLNVLAFGSEHAMHLGVDVKKLERRVFLASSLIVGSIVAVCGVIGFIGLIVPHMLRKIVGVDNRQVLPLSFIFGACLLVFFDACARASFQQLGTEPPVGAITALIGGPLFLILMIKNKR